MKRPILCRLGFHTTPKFLRVYGGGRDGIKREHIDMVAVCDNCGKWSETYRTILPQTVVDAIRRPE